MKRTCKVVMVIALIAALMALTSCDNMFTKSVMKGAARDPEKAASKLANKPTDELINDAENAKDRSSAQAIIGALNKKSEEEIKALDTDQKQAVLSAATKAVVDMGSLGGSVGGLLKDAGSSSSSNSEVADVMDDIIASAAGNDTTCVAWVLESSLDANGNIPADTPADMKSSLTMGAVAVAASSLANAGITDSNSVMDRLENADNISDVNTAAAQMLGSGADQKDVENLASALKTLKALQSSGYAFDQAFGQ